MVPVQTKVKKTEVQFKLKLKREEMIIFNN